MGPEYEYLDQAQDYFHLDVHVEEEMPRILDVFILLSLSCRTKLVVVLKSSYPSNGRSSVHIFVSC